MMNEEELQDWQNKVHKPGELLSIWDYELGKEVPCLVLEDKEKDINPFGRKSRIRRIKIMSREGIHEISRYDIFPPGEGRPSIPF